MNSILESRAVTISRLFRILDSYSPTKAMVQHLVEQGKIDYSKPLPDSKRTLIDYFQEEGLRYNVQRARYVSIGALESNGSPTLKRALVQF